MQAALPPNPAAPPPLYRYLYLSLIHPDIPSSAPLIATPLHSPSQVQVPFNSIFHSSIPPGHRPFSSITQPSPNPITPPPKGQTQTQSENNVRNPSIYLSIYPPSSIYPSNRDSTNPRLQDSKTPRLQSQNHRSIYQSNQHPIPPRLPPHPPNLVASA
ncbi:uncharacterized protein BO66DRAFT_205525 [Aspergillus aculeatinus CBS 121060]|uniref:Uncharacterized protein n=1 Tax=Aspergillus aculeatinus CBS 121060 TaxID=1448322 RepID=A0ACD1HJV7_9EURO|nr:hypothetical protein BO66DRAFT_205525 [Aspergillus aculeatinus CBS 121060]RAH73757.1 hypothetical protein BO66DRAFT_205525 [Aspergillus aculeatinus CBS 121060]